MMTRDLEIRHLRTICAIADAGSVSRAATVLGVTQPALTLQLRTIEKYVGGRLFERTAAGSEPTPLGDVVLRTARVMLQDMSVLNSSLRRYARPARDGGDLVVGTMPFVFVAPMMGLLRDSVRPGAVRLETTWDTAALFERLSAGQIDLAFLFLDRSFDVSRFPDVELRVLASEPDMVLLPVNHRLARHREVALGELADADWAYLPPDIDPIGPTFRAACAQAGFLPRVSYQVSDNWMAWSMVCAGAVSLASPQSAEWPGTVLRPLCDSPILSTVVMAARRDARETGTADTAFIAAANAYRSTLDRNSFYHRWWTRNPDAHSAIDAVLSGKPGRPTHTARFQSLAGGSTA